MTKELLSLGFVRSVAQRVGRAAADDVYGTHSSELEVDLKLVSGEVAATAAAKMREALSAFPGTAFSVNTFLTERIEETISGFTAPVVVNIYGNDLDATARDVAVALGSVRGATDIQMQSPPGAPQLTIRQLVRRPGAPRRGRPRGDAPGELCRLHRSRRGAGEDRAAT